MRDRSALVVLLAAWALGIARPAEAKEPPPVREEASADHATTFRRAFEQYEQGNYASAIATWESLLATMGEEQGFRVLYNLGLAYQEVGDVTRAIERLRAFEAQVAARPYAPAGLVARAEDAASRAAQMERTHGAVLVRPPSTGSPVLTRVGTAEPRLAGYVVWLAPGTHSVEIGVGTARARTVRVEVKAGARVEVDATSPAIAEPSPASKRPTTTTTTAGGGGLSPWVLTGAALTVASFALPIALYVGASDERAAAVDLGRGHAEYAAAVASYDDARTLYAISYALPATLALATGAIWLFGRSSDASPKARASIGPTGVVVGGAF